MLHCVGLKSQCVVVSADKRERSPLNVKCSQSESEEMETRSEIFNKEDIATTMLHQKVWRTSETFFLL